MRAVAFYNIKGGVGKTTSAVNIAYLASGDDCRVLLWDLDPQGAASFLLQVSPRRKMKTKKLLKGGKRLPRYIRESDYPALDVLPAPFGNRKLDVRLGRLKKPRKRLRNLLEDLEGSYDLVVFDCPPSGSVLSENVFRAADRLVVPTQPTPLGIRGVQQVLRHVEKHAPAPLPIIPFFTMVDRRKTLHRKLTDDPPEPLSFCRTTIPYLSAIEKMALHRMPLPAFGTRERGTAAYRDLWHEIRSRL